MDSSPPSSRPPIARSAALNLIGQVLPALVGLATVPVMVRGLGTADYGAFALAWVLLGYFTLFDLGLGRATTHFVAARVERAGAVRPVVETAVRAQLGLGLVGALLLATLGPLGASRLPGVVPESTAALRESVLFLAAALPFVLVTASLAGALEGLRRFDLLNAVRIPASLLVLLLPALAVMLGTGLRGAILALVAARMIGTAAFAAVVARLLRTEGTAASATTALADTSPDLDAPSRSLLSQLLRFGGWVTVSSVVSPLMVYSDRFVLASRQGLGAVGFYSAPYDVITRLWIVPSSLASVLFPEFTARGATGAHEASARLVLRAARALLLVMGMIVVVALPLTAPALTLWLGDEFAAQAARPAQWLLVGMLVNALAWVPMVHLQGIGRADLPARSHLVQLPLYALLLWWSTGRFGITGAAAAWTLRVAVDAAVLFALSARHQGAPPATLLRALAPVAGVIAAAILAPWLLLAPMPSLVPAGIAALLAGAAVALTGGLSLWPEERALLARLLPASARRTAA